MENSVAFRCCYLFVYCSAYLYFIHSKVHFHSFQSRCDWVLWCIIYEVVTCIWYFSSGVLFVWIARFPWHRMALLRFCAWAQKYKIWGDIRFIAVNLAYTKHKSNTMKYTEKWALTLWRFFYNIFYRLHGWISGFRMFTCHLFRNRISLGGDDSLHFTKRASNL